MPIPPIVLAVLLCDTVHRDWDNGKFYILGAFSALSFPDFPHTLASMNVFLSLTEVNGAYDLEIRIIDVNEEREPLYRLSGRLEGLDPLAVFEFALTLADVKFPEPDEYRLQVYIDGQILVERKILVRQKGREETDG